MDLRCQKRQIHQCVIYLFFKQVANEKFAFIESVSIFLRYLGVSGWKMISVAFSDLEICFSKMRTKIENVSKHTMFSERVVVRTYVPNSSNSKHDLYELFERWTVAAPRKKSNCLCKAYANTETCCIQHRGEECRHVTANGFNVWDQLVRICTSSIQEKTIITSYHLWTKSSNMTFTSFPVGVIF